MCGYTLHLAIVSQVLRFAVMHALVLAGLLVSSSVVTAVITLVLSWCPYIFPDHDFDDHDHHLLKVITKFFNV